MKLFLLRHAKSSWQAESLDDFERPLNRRGQGDAPEMANRLNAAGHTPSRILCSPALRTRQTSDLMMPLIGLQAGDRHFVQGIYEASPGTLIDVITEHGQETENLMVLGHNPGLEYLVTMLNGGERLTMATCAVCVFDILNISSWRQISDASSRLLMFDYPKNQAAHP